MAIISQETWNNIPKEEKDWIIKEYNSDAGEGHSMLGKLFGTHNLQPKVTYEDVMKELFGKNNQSWWTTNQGYISHGKLDSETKAFLNDNNCTSQKQAEKLIAINELLNVAKFLNKNEDGSDWVPDWEGDEIFYGIGVNPDDQEVIVFQVSPERIQTEIVYFRTKEIAQQAAEILGENVILTALGNY